ncbi:MAG: hypothetical protein J5590_03935 [Clostridia bacterium]|nr:hypothetical protein [Clostridia bacterium]
MFGYVNVDKEKIDARDYSLYRAVYCGICVSCGKHLSESARLGLSYDTAFLALVLSSLEDTLSVSPLRCITHPVKRHPIVTDSRAIDYAACVGAMLSYLKFDDDRRDEGGLKPRIGMQFFKKACRKARAQYPNVYEEIMTGLKSLSELEKENCQNADLAADAFAKILAACASPDFIDEKLHKPLYWLGYYLGRWIYLADALNDLERDIKSGAYNPYKSRFKTKSEAKDKLLPSLTLTLESISLSAELLPFKRNKAIIDNIIYYGLPKKQESILEGENK